MKEKFGKVVKGFITVLIVAGVFAAFIAVCELYQYLAVNVWGAA